MRINIFNMSGISDLNCDLLLGCSKNEFRDTYEIAVLHTCDSTAGSKKIPFSKPVCRSTVPVDQTTVFENFHKYYKNPIKKVSQYHCYGTRQSNGYQSIY